MHRVDFHQRIHSQHLATGVARVDVYDILINFFFLFSVGDSCGFQRHRGEFLTVDAVFIAVWHWRRPPDSLIFSLPSILNLKLAGMKSLHNLFTNTSLIEYETSFDLLVYERTEHSP